MKPELTPEQKQQKSSDGIICQQTSCLDHYQLGQYANDFRNAVRPCMKPNSPTLAELSNAIQVLDTVIKAVVNWNEKSDKSIIDQYGIFCPAEFIQIQALFITYSENIVKDMLITNNDYKKNYTYTDDYDYNNPENIL